MPQADVSIDGVSLGRTPVTHSLERSNAPGTLRFTRNGYRPLTRKIGLASDDTSSGAARTARRRGLHRARCGTMIALPASSASLALCLLFTVPPPVNGPTTDPRREADRLVEEGAAFGRERRWDDAIARFEAADALFPRAIHACNIGLVHARTGRPERALMHLAACQARTTEPLPPWVERRVAQTRAALVKGQYAPLELVAGTPGVQVTVLHFGAAVFTPPVTVWLPFGDHRLHAVAPGREPLDEVLPVTSKAPLRRLLVLALALPDAVTEPELPDPPDPDKQPCLTRATPTRTRRRPRLPGRCPVPQPGRRSQLVLARS